MSSASFLGLTVDWYVFSASLVFASASFLFEIAESVAFLAFSSFFSASDLALVSSASLPSKSFSIFASSSVLALVSLTVFAKSEILRFRLLTESEICCSLAFWDAPFFDSAARSPSAFLCSPSDFLRSLWSVDSSLDCSPIFFESSLDLPVSFSKRLFASDAAFLESSSFALTDFTCLSRFSSCLASAPLDFFFRARSLSALFLAESWFLRSFSLADFAFFSSLIFWDASLIDSVVFLSSCSAFSLAFLALSRSFSAAAFSLAAASADFFCSCSLFFSASAFFFAASAAFFSASAFFFAASAACLSLAALVPLPSAM